MRPLVPALASAVFLALFVALPQANAQVPGPYGFGPTAPVYGPQASIDPFAQPYPQPLPGAYGPSAPAMWGSPVPGAEFGLPTPGGYGDVLALTGYVNLTNAVAYQNLVNGVMYQNLVNAAMYQNLVNAAAQGTTVRGVTHHGAHTRR